jgi:metal-responsive CopG/Arc/MetJ family transcriptional regulator
VCGTTYGISMRGTTAAPDKTEKVGITLPRTLVIQADKLSGDVPRSTFIRRAVEKYINEKGPK